MTDSDTDDTDDLDRPARDPETGAPLVAESDDVDRGDLEGALACPACDRPVVASVAGGDASVRVADGYSVCELGPHEHGATGFRWFVHREG